MSSIAQKKALQSYRQKIVKRGLVRFEVMAPKTDRDILREVAVSLTEGGAEAEKLRLTLKAALSSGERSKGGVFAALRRSPLVGSDIQIKRSRDKAREVKL